MVYDLQTFWLCKMVYLDDVMVTVYDTKWVDEYIEFFYIGLI